MRRISKLPNLFKLYNNKIQHIYFKHLRNRLKSSSQFDPTNHHSKLKIATVVDEFTYYCLSYEADVLQLEFESYYTQIERFKPDIVLIESAWFGKQKSWRGLMSIIGQQVFELIRFCRRNHILIVFWNKEDPTHFDHFIALAKMVDIVFTTDIDCISRYKHMLGHDKVFLLQFAAQPRIHNPIEKYTRKEAFCFAGAYYMQHPDRQADFDILINAALKYLPVEIYDRNYKSQDPYNVPFPEVYSSYVIGNLKFSEIDKAYKGYKFAINVNTVKTSQTMFSRRVFELMASNTLILSNFSAGIQYTFGNLWCSSDDKLYLDKYIQLLTAQPRIYRKLRLWYLREVMTKHTYADRVNTLKSAITGLKYSNLLPKILMVSVINNEEELLQAQKIFTSQIYKYKQLLILDMSGSINRVLNDVMIFDNYIDIFKHIKDDIGGFCAFISNYDYYGSHYLLDLALSIRYSDCKIIGKRASFERVKGSIILRNDGKQYHLVKILNVRSAIIAINIISMPLFKSIIFNIDTKQLLSSNMLAIDEFNYCLNGSRYYGTNYEDYFTTDNLVQELNYYLGTRL